MSALYQTALKSAGDYDVIVAGGGSAGVVAAIASSRGGARTLLIESNGFLGGISTAVLDTFYGFYTPGSRALRVVDGIPGEVVRALVELGMAFERPNTFGSGTGVTYHPEYLKVVWERLAKGAGVACALHSRVVDVLTNGNRVSSVVIAGKDGLVTATARHFIDASGDADLVHFAGGECEIAALAGNAQTLTTTFKMVNVDLDARLKLPKGRVHKLMEEAAQSGRFRLPRKEGSDHRTPVRGMTATIMTRLPSFEKDASGKIVTAASASFLSAAEIEGREQALEYIRFLRECVPGYEKAELSTFSSQIGVRETRRVKGEYWLTKVDVLEARQFDDQIGLCGAPMEDHHGGADTHWVYLPDGHAVGVPFRCLVSRSLENVMVAGRCFSASHEAHASVRSMAQTMAMGQAVGSAAALATRSQVSIRDVSIEALRTRLLRDGAILCLS